MKLQITRYYLALAYREKILNGQLTGTGSND